MIIALDYDGCFTEDEVMWYQFVLNCKRNGHRIIMVTMRYPSEHIGTEHSNMEKDIKAFLGTENIFYTSRRAKRPFMEALGIKPNIWIDDHPQSVFMDAEQIWGISLPEGHTDSTNAIRD